MHFNTSDRHNIPTKVKTNKQKNIVVQDLKPLKNL